MATDEATRALRRPGCTKVNIEDSPSLAAQYGIDSIPSLKVFKHGVVTEQLVGLANKSQLKSRYRAEWKEAHEHSRECDVR